jgi:hypothetical protein
VGGTLKRQANLHEQTRPRPCPHSSLPALDAHSHNNKNWTDAPRLWLVLAHQQQSVARGRHYQHHCCHHQRPSGRLSLRSLFCRVPTPHTEEGEAPESGAKYLCGPSGACAQQSARRSTGAASGLLPLARRSVHHVVEGCFLISKMASQLFLPLCGLCETRKGAGGRGGWRQGRAGKM